MTKPKTVKDHIEASDRIIKTVNEANALVKKLRDRLEDIRSTLEALKPYQHDKLKMSMPCHLRAKEMPSELSPRRVIEQEIKRINAILGDRA